MSKFGRFFAAALLAAFSLRAAAAGLDPAVAARVKADADAIRKADASRRAVLLDRTSEQGDRFRALEDFRDRRRKAVLDAAEALVAVKGAVPKEEWKEILGQLSAGAGMPLLVDRAQQELPAAVADAGRRDAAARILADLSAVIKKDRTNPLSARKKFFDLLDKKNVTRDDFISGLEKVTEAQEKIDTKIVDGIGALQRTLTPEEWADLVRRASPAAPPGN